MTKEFLIQIVMGITLVYLAWKITIQPVNNTTIDNYKKDNITLTAKIDSLQRAMFAHMDSIKINNTKITNIRNSYITDTTYVQSITNNDSLFSYVQYQIDMLGKPRYY